MLHAPEKAGPVCHVCNRSGTGGNTSAKGIVLLCREALLYSAAHGQEPLLKTLLPAEEMPGLTMPCHPAEMLYHKSGHGARRCWQRDGPELC